MKKEESKKKPKYQQLLFAGKRKLVGGKSYMFKYKVLA